MISSKDRYFATLVSGYLLMALQIVLALATVPIALKYLGKEEFGIWSLATQVAIWLQLLDAGMNGAISRHLIDYRNDPDGEGLSRCLATGFRVLCLQGLVIFVMAFLVGRFAGPVFGLSPDDAAAFGKVLLMLGFGTAVSFVIKVVTSWLYASQRLDLCNFVSLGIFVLEFTVFWLLISHGVGIFALAWARVFTALAAFVVYGWIAAKVVGFPLAMLTSRWDRDMFLRLASYGGGMFMLTLGTQLLTMTQTAMVTKKLGLVAAAVWATAPKLFQLVLQTVSKLWDYRVPYLSSLMAEEQIPTLTRSFQGLFRATAYIGGGGLGAIVALNPVFLNIWTHQQIQWASINDGLIAGVFYLSLLIRCVTDFVMHTKKIGWMPFLMLCEGLIFVVSSLFLLPVYGIPGMLAASLVTGGLLRLPYAWTKFSSFLALPKRETRSIVAHALGGALLGGAIYLMLYLVRGWWPGLPPWVSLIGQSVLAAVILGPLAIKLVFASQRPAQA
jgi:O-antigen/teichoic acid export membrane protein